MIFACQVLQISYICRSLPTSLASLCDRPYARPTGIDFGHGFMLFASVRMPRFRRGMADMEQVDLHVFLPKSVPSPET